MCGSTRRLFEDLERYQVEEALRLSVKSVNAPG